MAKLGPDVWGPHAWKFLHFVSLGYPDYPTNEDKHKYKSFFLLLQNVLPCSVCREHYKENYDKLPLTDNILSSRDNLIKWVIDLHNIVNKMKNKPVIDHQTAINLITNNFENNNNKDNKNNNNTLQNDSDKLYNDSDKLYNIHVLIFILLLIIFTYIIIKKRFIFN